MDVINYQMEVVMNLLNLIFILFVGLLYIAFTSFLKKLHNKENTTGVIIYGAVLSAILGSCVIMLFT